MSIGGSSERSSSSTNTTRDAFTVSRSQIDARQRQMQEQLFSQSQGLQGQATTYQGNAAQANAGWNTANLRAGGFNADAVAGYQGGAMQGMDRLSQFSQQQNPYLQNQINQFGNDLGRQFTEQIIPGIRGGATVAGQRGSSRQGIAEGLAAQGVQQQFARGVTDMRMQGYGQQQAAAGQLASLGQQGYGTAAGLRNQNIGMRADNNAQYYTNQQALGLRPFQIGQSIVGAPSVLQNSMGIQTERSRSTSSGRGTSANIGLT
jgi:hypothetical protein